MAIIVNSALRLPAPDIEALIQGRIITALSCVVIDRRGAIALYPSDSSINLLPIEKQYRSEFVPIAQSAFEKLNSEKVLIKSWATCEFCQPISHLEILDALSTRTIWTPEALKAIIAQRKTIFLTYLRVSVLQKPFEIESVSTGTFIRLAKNLDIIGSSLVLKNEDFDNQLENLIKLEKPPVVIPDNPTGLSWINDIVRLGDRSIELEEKKTTYQAGTDFENIVKKSLEFLGFTIDYSHKGGAGGLDLLCLKPYPLFGECKAGKSIPNDTVVQLLNLGTIRNNELFQKTDTVKLIIGSGKPTSQVVDGANVHKMVIINPISLQKLVELKAKYDGALNLFELKKYFQVGQIEDKIEEYIQKVEGDIKLRSYIVQTVKELQDADSEHPSPIEIRTHYNAKKQGSNLSLDSTKEILIELSSPLAGYLGRDKSNEGKGDRFYYLRNLTI